MHPGQPDSYRERLRMNITIYQQPDCPASPDVLGRIRAEGHEPVIIDIQSEPPTRAQLLALLVGMQMTPRDILRKEVPTYAQLGLNDQALSDREILGALSDHPSLIQSPIVVSDKGIRLCVNDQALAEIL